jgi:diguanylate cyclase (GGDEF)-like protein
MACFVSVLGGFRGLSIVSFEALRFGRARLHWLFVLIVLVAVAPVFGLYFGRLHSSSERAVLEARAHAATLALNGATAHAEIGGKARHLLEMIAQSPSLRGTADDCEKFLEWVQYLTLSQNGRPWVTGLFEISPEGLGTCGTFPNARTLDVRDREYYLRMLESRNFVTSEILVGRLSKRLIIASALPIYSNTGKLQFSLGVGADLYQLNDIAVEANTKYNGTLVVLAANGSVVANLPSQTEGEVSQSFNEPEVIKKILSANAPILEAVDTAGVRRIYGIKQLPNGQTIAVSLNRDAVLAPIERAFRSDLLFLLLITASSIAAALIVAEFGVLRGVRLLKNAALRLKAGKMGVRVKLPILVAAELHDLSVTYNTMTAEFERLAYLDRLTGLPNRRYLERQLSNNTKLGQNRLAVLAIDLDGFKPVNDTFGHAVGDRVLVAVARRIAAALNERGILARVGGDEFIALIQLPKAGCREFARDVGEEIRASMETSMDVDGAPFLVGCSVGIAIMPDDATSLAGALVVADAALYEAKRAGRNRVIDHAPPLASEAFAEDDHKQPHWTALEFTDPL